MSFTFYTTGRCQCCLFYRTSLSRLSHFLYKFNFCSVFSGFSCWHKRCQCWMGLISADFQFWYQFNCKKNVSLIAKVTIGGQLDFQIGAYDRVWDVVENGVSFASKILTHNRMHWHWSTIANLKANMPRIQNMYNMYRAKVDRLAGKTDFLQKMA